MKNNKNINKKKYLKTILLLIFIIIMCIFYKQRHCNISAKLYARENYIFVTKWGSEGADYGEFGCDFGHQCKLKFTDKTIENLKNKLSDKKLQQFKKFLKEHHGKLKELYLLQTELKFDQREYDMVLSELNINKPEVSAYSRWGGPDYIAVDKSDNIYVMDIQNNRLQKFDSIGNFMTCWYTTAGAYLSDIKVDNKGNTYLFDYEKHLNKFDSNGKFIKKLNFRYDGIKQPDRLPDGLQGLIIDDKGYIFIVDYEDYVSVFDPNGIFIKKWSIYNYGFKKMRKNQGGLGRSIIVDENGFVYIDVWETTYRFERRNKIIPLSFFMDDDMFTYVEGFGPGVVKYDSSGNYITKWNKKDFDDEGVTVRIGRITTDFKGNIFIADRASHCIQKFDTNGNFITKFGSKGSEDGQFLYPQAVAVDKKGNVYVMDSGNFRVQKFTLQRRPVSNN